MQLYLRSPTMPDIGSFSGVILALSPRREFASLPHGSSSLRCTGLANTLRHSYGR